MIEPEMSKYYPTMTAFDQCLINASRVVKEQGDKINNNFGGDKLEQEFKKSLKRAQKQPKNQANKKLNHWSKLNKKKKARNHSKKKQKVMTKKNHKNDNSIIYHETLANFDQLLIQHNEQKLNDVKANVRELSNITNWRYMSDVSEKEVRQIRVMQMLTKKSLFSSLTNTSAIRHSLEDMVVKMKEMYAVVTEEEPAHVRDVSLTPWNEIQLWRGFKPSNIICAEERIRNLVITNSAYNRQDMKVLNEAAEKKECLNEFLRLPIKTEDTIKGLAKKYDVKGGKWILFVEWGETADRVWQQVLKLFFDKEFDHKEIRLIKIQIFDNKPNPYTRKNTGEVKIAICVKDFVDGHIGDIGRKIRAKVSTRDAKRIMFKADIYTQLKIYVDNQYGIRPTLFEL